jgi:hypothetical protein
MAARIAEDKVVSTRVIRRYVIHATEVFSLSISETVKLTVERVPEMFDVRLLYVVFKIEYESKLRKCASAASSAITNVTPTAIPTTKFIF